MHGNYFVSLGVKTAIFVHGSSSLLLYCQMTRLTFLISAAAKRPKRQIHLFSLCKVSVMKVCRSIAGGPSSVKKDQVSSGAQLSFQSWSTSQRKCIAWLLRILARQSIFGKTQLMSFPSLALKAASWKAIDLHPQSPTPPKSRVRRCMPLGPSIPPLLLVLPLSMSSFPPALKMSFFSPGDLLWIPFEVQAALFSRRL